MTRTRDCSSCCPGAEILPAICTRSPAETPESEGTLKYMPTPWSWTNRTRHSGSLYVATAVVWTLVPRTDWLAFTISERGADRSCVCLQPARTHNRASDAARRRGTVQRMPNHPTAARRKSVYEGNVFLPVGSAGELIQNERLIFFHDAFTRLPESVSQPRRERSQKIM